MLTWIKSGNFSIPTALLTHYKKLNLDDQEMILILHLLSFIEKGNFFPTPVELAQRMTGDCSMILRRLIQKGFIDIKEGFSEEGIRYEMYCLDPLWNKLINQFKLQQTVQETEQQQKQETDLYSCFETEFGRPLSPFECESLSMWLDDDQHNPVIIKAALREAVISGKLNFRYIDRILFEWKKNGIKTIEQAKNYARKFRKHQQANRQKDETKEKPGSVPFYNWLEQ